ncbi:hypothetical protein DMENIID0001_098410 [Sergentomyia squamirostris]
MNIECAVAIIRLLLDPPPSKSSKYPLVHKDNAPLVANNGALCHIPGGGKSPPGTTPSQDVDNDEQMVVKLPREAEEIALPARDLLERLLVVNPQKRIRSVLGLERIAMFKDFSFDDCKRKKMKPSTYIYKHRESFH